MTFEDPRLTISVVLASISRALLPSAPTIIAATAARVDFPVGRHRLMAVAVQKRAKRLTGM